jgi:two-component system, sensor histidine kinase
VRRIGIRLRVFLAMMTVIGGFLVLTWLVMGGLVNRFLDAEIANSLTLGRKAYVSFVSVREAVLLDHARSVAQVPHLRAVLDTPDVDEETIGYSLKTLGEAVGAALLFVTDAQGRILADTRGEAACDTDVASRPDVQRALQGREYTGIWDDANGPYLVALAPVTLDSNVLGVLGIGYPIEQHVGDLHDVTGLDITVLRGSEVIASSWKAKPSAATGRAWSRVPTQRHERFVVGGREFMATAVLLEPAGMRLVLSRPLDLVLVYFAEAKTEILLCSLVVAALALFVSQFIASRIARPIGELTQAANTLARGELSTEVHVDTDDEIGALGSAFNAMARQLEALMQQTVHKAQAAEQASAAKSVFLATMSHELRTPLNGVLGFTDQLLQSQLDDEQREQALYVHRSAQDLLAIIDDVLDFARVDTGRLKLEESEFDLTMCLTRAVDALKPLLDAKALALSVSVDPNVPATLVGPASRLRQIVLNYVGNAVKFTDKGSITVRATLAAEDSEHALVRVEVEDTGIGIAPVHLDRLFKPFSQIDSGRSRKYGGTGLGLAICKELTQLMGGEVGVTSEPGRGSTFWFTVRLAKAAPASSLAPALPASRAAVGGPSAGVTAPEGPGLAPGASGRAHRRILVAEDNVVNQRMTIAVLTKAGFAHALADNGSVALERLRVEAFDLVLMDVQMPTMDGLEATRRIRELESGTDRHIPIVALTANAFDADRQACFEAGMDDFIAKPFKAPELVATIDRWLAASPTHGSGP